MPRDDYAILVGITRYPNITTLDGPEFDARQFLAWLTGPGEVPEENIVHVFTSEFAGAEEPTMENVEDRFEQLRFRVEQVNEQERRRRRRLYIFLAGHGLSWAADSAALLTANAAYTQTRRSRHIAGSVFAEWFRDAGLFEEVVLVMDCCRTEYPETRPQQPWENPTDDSYKEHVRYFHAFATKGGAAARERVIPPGATPQGLFTYAFLEGLNHADVDERGRLTGEALCKYISTRLPQLDQQFKQEPHFVLSPPSPEPFVWAVRPPPVHNVVTVVVNLPRPWPVEVWSPDLKSRLGVFNKSPFVLQDLPEGIYDLHWPADGHDLAFDVIGTARVITVVVQPDPATQREQVTYATA